MVKVDFSTNKGLVQSAGSGFVVNDATVQAQAGMQWGVEKLTGANALSITVPVSLIDTTGGAAAITLADGSTAGQMKTVIMVKDAGDATLTIATPAGASDTYVFANVGENLLLCWVVDEDGTDVGWAALSRGTGAAALAETVAGLPVASAS